MLAAEQNVKKSKCVFMDRDGVLNQEIGRHIFTLEEFVIPSDVPEGLKRLKAAGYKLVVVTNQSGIARGYYDAQLVEDCHKILQDVTGGIIDKFYYAPLVPHVSESLMRKPDSLMMEKGLALMNGDPQQSWMVGDKGTDLKPALKLGMRRIQINSMYEASELAEFHVNTFTEIVDTILQSDQG
jgi:D-glycero-D-manno-heptose 1,7-bisphosphate phosphatase